VPLSKRLFDLTLSATLVVLLLPLFALLALLVLLVSGPPVLFRQERPGYRGSPFFILKFRSMTAAPNDSEQDANDAARLTPLGRVMRSLSLDELPELLNILRGQMSFVGPRPLLMQYLPLYNAEQMRRHEAYPGLTGWSQVHGRNILDWKTRFELDVWYVDHWSFWLDMRILFLTVWKVLKREGINQPGEATTEYFTGNQD
jgi:sugar transferase EpsL